MVLLIGCDNSSLVIDKLCDEAAEEDTTVTCFYFDFAARNEQSPMNMLGSLLRQVVTGLEEFPEAVVQGFRNEKKVIGGRGLQVPGILKMFKQTIAATKRTFICVDALDECTEEDRVDILVSLRQILGKSSTTRIFLTGRLHIRSEIDRHLGATVLSIKPNRDDILGYVRMRLSKDTSLGRIDSGLEDEIIKSITWNTPQT